MQLATRVCLGFAIGLLMCVARIADGAVSTTNGNFFIGYTDLDGFDDSFERVYNSKTSYTGMLGWGWGNKLEAFLSFSGDGRIVVHENGGGAENIFARQGHPTPAELDATLDTLVAASGKPEGEVEMYRAKLATNARFAEDEWLQLQKKGKVPRSEGVENVEYISEKYGHQTLRRIGAIYERVLENHQVETYDRDGHLIRFADANGNFTQLARDRQGRIVLFSDSSGRKVTFSYDAKSHLVALGVLGPKPRRVEYRYDQYDNLVYSRNSGNDVYVYAYDRRHNLTEIRYADHTKLVIGYHLLELNENVSFVRDRDGSMTTYSYFTDPADSGHTFTTIENAEPNGKPTSTSEYEYYRATLAQGQIVQTRLITTLDGDRTDTRYDTNCGSPLRIERNGDTTTFTYDAKCHVTSKDTPTTRTVLAYDPGAGKVARVDREQKSTHAKTWATYRYDSKANLVAAESSEGKQLALDYDDRGRIAILREIKPTSLALHFKYNNTGKPTEIDAEGVGKLIITYKADETTIDKVDSSAGRGAALQVTTAFQELLDVIRPAGITLNL